MAKKRKSNVNSVSGTPIVPFTAKERRRIDKRMKEKYERFRRRYPEVHGKLVDFITIPSRTERCISAFASKTRRISRSAMPVTYSL